MNTGRSPDSWLKEFSRATRFEINTAEKNLFFKIPLAPSTKEFPFDISDYDGFWLDQKKSFNNDGQCGISFEISGRQYNQITKQSFSWSAKLFDKNQNGLGNKSLSINNQEGFYNYDFRNFESPGPAYVVKRLLGFATDIPRWTLFVDGQHHSLKRTINLRADSLSLIKLTFFPEDIEVEDLVVSISDANGKSPFKQISITPTVVKDKFDSRFSVSTFNIQAAIERQREHQAGNIRAGADDELIKEISIELIRKGGKNGVLSLEFVKKPLLVDGFRFKPTPELERSVADLRGFFVDNDFQGGRNPDIKYLLGEVNAIIGPVKNPAACIQSIKSIRLVKTRTKLVPRYSRDLTDWNRHVGGPSIPEEDLGFDQLEDPGIFRYLSVSTIIGGVANSDWRGNFRPHQHLGLMKNSEFIKFSNYDKNGRAIPLSGGVIRNTEGAVLQVGGGALNIDRAGRNVIIYSSGSGELVWPIESELPHNSNIYIGNGTGNVSDDSALMILEGVDTKKSLEVRLNQPTKIPNELGYIKYIRIVPRPVNYPYVFNIQDVSIFKPKIISFNEALSVAVPGLVSIKPASDRGDSSSSNGVISGLVNGGSPIFFKGELKNTLSGVYGISVDYKLDEGLVLEKNVAQKLRSIGRPVKHTIIFALPLVKVV